LRSARRDSERDGIGGTAAKDRRTGSAPIDVKWLKAAAKLPPSLPKQLVPKSLKRMVAYVFVGNTQVEVIRMKILGAIGLVIFLFLLVYAPVFFLVSVLHLSKAAMIPAVIVGSTIMAFAAAGLLAWWRKLRLADFGIRFPEIRYLVYALLVSMPLGVFSALGAARVHEPGPLQGVVLAPALTYLYFAIGAPMQEEFIFRGLLQTAMADGLRNSVVASWAGVFAVLAVGLLFALIHFEVGPFMAACALVLALVAGEFRRRSSSVAPAVVCHAIFNLAAIVLG